MTTRKQVWEARKVRIIDMFSTEEVSLLSTKATELIDDDSEKAIKAFNGAVRTLSKGLLQAVM